MQIHAVGPKRSLKIVRYVYCVRDRFMQLVRVFPYSAIIFNRRFEKTPIFNDGKV